MAKASSLGQRVAEVLSQRGITKEQLEKKAGIGTGYVSRLIKGERGDGITVAQADKIAAALGVNLTWLITGEGMRDRVADDQAAEHAALEFAPRPPASWAETVVASARLLERCATAGDLDGARKMHDAIGQILWVAEHLDNRSTLAPR